jgi:hypothetical protein
MIQSRFEKFNEKLLKKMLTTLFDALLEEGVEDPIRHNLEDYEVFTVVENTIKMLGFEPEWDDVDFIFALYSLNFNSFNEDAKIESTLVIPKPATYRYEVDVHETVYQRTTYEHTYESYSEKNVFPLSRKADEEGYVTVWDGNEIDRDVYDSETSDIKWDYDSLRKIN